MTYRELLVAAALGAALISLAGCDIARRNWSPPKPIEIKVSAQGQQAGIDSDSYERVEGASIEIYIMPLEAEGSEQTAASGGGTVVLETYDWDKTSYRELMRRKLLSFWVPKLEQTMQYKSDIPGRAVFSITVGRDGGARHVELIESSGIDQYDQAAENAILLPYPGLATEFRPLPDDFHGRTFTATITFYVNLVPKKESEKEK